MAGLSLKISRFTRTARIQLTPYRAFLREISAHSYMIPGERLVVRNCIPDELAKAGTKLAISDNLQGIFIPIASVLLDIFYSIYEKA